MIKRIETRESIEKKDRRNKIIIGIILVSIMLLSTAGYAFFNESKTSSKSGSDKLRYGGVEFYYDGNRWQAQISGANFYFSYSPNETSVFNIKKKIGDYSNKPLYFTSNGLAEQEILFNLQNFVSRSQIACLQADNCTENLPEKNCTDNIIIIREEGNVNLIREEGNCVFIISNDTLRAADSFMYGLLKIN